MAARFTRLRPLLNQFNHTKEMDKSELPPTAAHVLDHLRWSDDNTLTVSTLAERTGRHPDTICEAAETLADEGLVTYSPATNDARERQLKLRDSG